MKEEEKSCALIGTCLDLFMKFGIKSLTMDDISRKLGISKKTLYQHVSDKKELVKKGMILCLKEDQKLIVDITTKSDNAIDELIGFTKSVNARLSEMHDSVIFDLKKYHPESWTLMETHKNEFIRNSILENTKRGITEGIYRENLNPEIISSLYILMKDGLFQSEEGFWKDVRLQDLHLEMIRYHVRGVANDKGIALLKETLSRKENNHLDID